MTILFRSPTVHSEWQARHLGRDLTPAEVCLVEAMSAAGMPPHRVRLGPLRSERTAGASRTVYGDLATWDQNRLTLLVFAAHDACARLSIVPAGPYVRVVLYLRSTEPGELPIARGHPTLEEAVAAWRAVYPARPSQE